MIIEATTFSRHIREQDAGYETFTNPNSLRRLRYFIEHSDWDEVILAQEEWIDNLRALQNSDFPRTIHR